MGELLDLYLMSPPGPRWALKGRANFRAAEASQVDAARGLSEWVQLADTIEARGGRVVSLVADDDGALTGLPYTAECGQVVAVTGERPRFLLPRMKPEHRQGERALWRQAAESMGMTPVDIAGTWEAQGDVAFFDGRLLLFHGGRTTRQGAEDAARHLARAYGEPLFVEVREPAFHGNMALLPLAAAGRALVCPDVIAAQSLHALAQAFGRERLLDVTVDEMRAYATNGLPMARAVLAPHLTPPRVHALLSSLGLDVVLLDMHELCAKAGGASRCLVSHARVEASDVVIPPALDYRVRRGGLVQRLPESLGRALGAAQSSEPDAGTR